MLCCRVGWSDLALFTIFKHEPLLSIRYISRSLVPKNRQIRPQARQSFNFKKTTGILKMSIFLKMFKNLSSQSQFSEAS